jgi:hypothetical protein
VFPSVTLFFNCGGLRRQPPTPPWLGERKVAGGLVFVKGFLRVCAYLKAGFYGPEKVNIGA